MRLSQRGALFYALVRVPKGNGRLLGERACPTDSGEKALFPELAHADPMPSRGKVFLALIGQRFRLLPRVPASLGEAAAIRTLKARGG